MNSGKTDVCLHSSSFQILLTVVKHLVLFPPSAASTASGRICNVEVGHAGPGQCGDNTLLYLADIRAPPVPLVALVWPEEENAINKKILQNNKNLRECSCITGTMLQLETDKDLLYVLLKEVVQALVDLLDDEGTSLRSTRIPSGGFTTTLCSPAHTEKAIARDRPKMTDQAETPPPYSAKVTHF